MSAAGIFPALWGQAEEWAGEAGMSLEWRQMPEAQQMLTCPDPTKRALWRCAVQLAARLDSAAMANALLQRVSVGGVADAPGR